MGTRFTGLMDGQFGDWIMTKLVWRADGVTVKEYVLQPGLNRVGRSAASDVRIDDTSVSGSHCEIWVREESLLVRDLDSTNGTFLDGAPVKEAEIRRGQILKIGGVEFAIKDPPARVAIPETATASEPIPLFLPDGKTPCCRKHHEREARFGCTKCEGQWCVECVRHLGRTGGKVMIFCVECGGVCQGVTGGRGGGRPPVVLYWLDRLVDNFRPRPKYAGRTRRLR
ncbi:MAG: FHA domain-containing protein [Verrucomicrobiales bacterium]|nr:FHA domain-containing protein [Verrucomicrobiales bacterium]